MKKTVTVNGEKIKVEFSKKLIKEERFDNESNKEKGKIGIIQKVVQDLDFIIDGKTFKAQRVSFLKNTKIGYRTSLGYYYNGISFGDSEKKTIEAMLRSEVNESKPLGSLMDFVNETC